MTRRWGLGLYQMIVHDRPVLIYAGQSERDVDRYIVLEAGRVVYKFQGDVLAAADSAVIVTDATPSQIHAWDTAFKVAVAAGDAKFSNPATFALAVG
jgi:hypothetical protein